MPEDNNDFMETSFRNYDITENRMSDGGSGGQNAGGCDTGRGNRNTAPTWKVVVGSIWGIIFLVIAVLNNGRAGNPDNPVISLLASIIAIAGLILIPFWKGIVEGRKTRREGDKAVRSFEDAVREQRLQKIKEFIENNKGTELGERIGREFGQIDNTDLKQLNSLWGKTPEGKKEFEKLNDLFRGS